MRASTRPGGVPDELETLALAETIAGAIWTVDGAAWDTTAIGGFCGASTCTLDVAGSRDDRDGEDLWTLEIDRQSGAVEPLVADVHSLPSEVISAVDGLARGLVPEIEDEELVLASVRWLPPPSGPGRFELSYRSGGEEGSCAREITVDVTRRAVLRATVTGC